MRWLGRKGGRGKELLGILLVSLATAAPQSNYPGKWGDAAHFRLIDSPEEIVVMECTGGIVLGRPR